MKNTYNTINQSSNSGNNYIMKTPADTYESGRNTIQNMVEKGLKIFIVHGHNKTAVLELKNYVQNTLKLPEPIVLAEKPSRGLTIIEKFEEYSKEVGVVFILMTPDDFTNDQKSRARQNVIFELGYFMGKLGRKSGKIILLLEGELELPSDISGIVYIHIDHGIVHASEEIRQAIGDINL